MWHGLFDGDCDGNDEVNTVVVIGLTAWVSWGDTGLDGLAESSCWKMIRMMLFLYYRVCHRELINHSGTWSPCSNFYIIIIEDWQLIIVFVLFLTIHFAHVWPLCLFIFLTFCSGRLEVMITVWLAGSSSVELQRSFWWGWSFLIRDKMIRVVFWMNFYLLLVLDLSRSAWTSKDGDSELSAWNLTFS